MTKIDWFIFMGVWLLMPAILCLKIYLDHRREKIWHDTQKAIDDGINDLINRCR